MSFLKKHKKASIISIITICILVITGIFICIISNRKNQKSLDTLYYEQNRAFSNTYKPPTDNKPNSANITSSNATSNNAYLPYSSGGKNILYADLYFHEQDTGNELTLEDVQEYLSQQYEEDGSVRIYNNGKHKNIQKYVEWYLENGTLESEKLLDLYNVYWSSIAELYPEETPELATNFLYLPFEEFVKVVEKYKDPSYDFYIPYDVAFPGGTF